MYAQGLANAGWYVTYGYQRGAAPHAMLWTGREWRAITNQALAAAYITRDPPDPYPLPIATPPT